MGIGAALAVGSRLLETWGSCLIWKSHCCHFCAAYPATAGHLLLAWHPASPQISRAAEYFKRWVARWPTVEALAAASQDEVNEAWAGLGYYR